MGNSYLYTAVSAGFYGVTDSVSVHISSQQQRCALKQSSNRSLQSKKVQKKGITGIVPELDWHLKQIYHSVHKTKSRIPEKSGRSVESVHVLT